MSWTSLWKLFGSDPYDRQASVQASQIAQELAGGLWMASQASAWSMTIDAPLGS